MKPSLLDTDILSYYFKGNELVINNVISYLKKFPTLNISSITYYEIVAGLEYKNAKKQLKEFEKFSESCNIINIDDDSIHISAKEYGRLRRAGITIGTADLLIAGIAIKNKLTLITNNTDHYKSINKLKIDNWTKNK